jgi:hypothetical protein
LDKGKIRTILDELSKMSLDIRHQTIKGYSLPVLEELALASDERQRKPNSSDLLNALMYERKMKIDTDFHWMPDNKANLLKINDTFISVFQNAYNEALKTASELEKRIDANDQFLKDYEIDIQVSPVFNDETDDMSIDDILIESASKLEHWTLSHSLYKQKLQETPLYLDRTQNYNNSEYFDREFPDDFIGWSVYELMSTGIWSLSDVLRIDTVWADVVVTKQGYIKV